MVGLGVYRDRPITLTDSDLRDYELAWVLLPLPGD